MVTLIYVDIKREELISYRNKVDNFEINIIYAFYYQPQIYSLSLDYFKFVLLVNNLYLFINTMYK